MEIYDFDIVAANNNGTPPNGFPEFMEYDEVNNAARELMAALARWHLSAFSGGNTTAGTQPAYTLTSQLSLSAYAAGQVFAFVAHATSTGSVTLAVDGLAADNVLDARGNQLGSGDVVANGVYIVIRTASAFRVLGALSSASVQALARNTLASAYAAGGTADALTLTTGLFTAYADGQLIAFRGGASNTSAATINIDGLGAEALEDYRSAALSAGDIQADRVYLAGRTGGEWRIIAGLPTDLANEVVGVLPIANGGTGQTSAANAFGALKQAATESATGVLELATTAEVRSSAIGDKALTAQDVEEASALVALSDAATVSVDWDAGINFSLTVTANRAIGNPTNGQPGTWRTIYVLGNNTTDRTITFGNQYLGEVPEITDCDSTRGYLLMIYCVTTSHFVVSAKRALGAAS